ncbi:MAG: recombinase family protein [Clostridia bacterium]|nr:recombinase family protein [Clostridia bacterium]
MIRAYARVSSKNQERYGNGLETQIAELKAAGAEKIYTDAFTGAKSSRPNFDKLLADLEPNDTLMVTKLDRFARSITQGNEIITQLIDKGVKVHILNMGLLDSSPTNSLLRNIVLAFSEFERQLILERTSSGKMYARENNPNFKEGRPKVYSDEQINLALSLLENNSYRQVEKMTGISKTTILRARRNRNICP